MTEKIDIPSRNAYLLKEASGIARSFFRNCQIRPGNKFSYCQIDLSISGFFLIDSSVSHDSKDAESRKRFSKA